MVAVMDKHYWERSRQVRETFARFELGNVLNWAFAQADEVLASPEDQLEDFLYGVRGRISAVEPAWESAMEALRLLHPDVLRSELGVAFTKIRAIAADVAAKNATDPAHISLVISLSPAQSDRVGHPRWMLTGRLADALVWMALKLFSEVPRSLIRSCAFKECSRIYVATGPQKYCLPHQAEAARLAQRQAEKAFRERQRAEKQKPTRRRKTR